MKKLKFLLCLLKTKMGSYYEITPLATKEQQETITKLKEKLLQIEAWDSVRTLADDAWVREQKRVNEDERDARLIALFERAIEHKLIQKEQMREQEMKYAIIYQINKKMPKCSHSYNQRGEVEWLKKISNFVYSRPPPYIRRQIEEIQEINDAFKKNWGTIEMPACDECCSPDEKILRGALINLLVKPELINDKLKEESLKAYRENLEIKKAEQRARIMAEAQERLMEKKKKQDEQNAIQNKLDSILNNGW